MGRPPSASDDSASSLWPSGFKVTDGLRESKELRGWLKKHHHSERSLLLASGRSKRFVWVDEGDGCLYYAHKEHGGAKDTKKICHLRELTNVQLAHNMHKVKEVKCIILFFGRADDEQELTFTCDDRETARMWLDRTRAGF